MLLFLNSDTKKGDALASPSFKNQPINLNINPKESHVADYLDMTINSLSVLSPCNTDSRYTPFSRVPTGT